MSTAIGTFKIYEMVDPLDGLPFYVGYTANTEQRLEQHLAGDASNLAGQLAAFPTIILVSKLSRMTRPPG